MSMGNGNTIVEFFSAEMVLRVCDKKKKNQLISIHYYKNDKEIM